MKTLAGFLSLALLVPAWSTAMAEPETYVAFEGEAMRQGRRIWLGTCEACHGYGVAGAPIPMKAADWEKRVVKPKEVLYDHAINGFFGPDDTMMPERGGNPALSDEEVMRAVDYMVELAKFYQAKQRGN